MRARVLVVDDDPALAEMLGIGPAGNQITIDVPAHTVARDGDEVKLTPLEFDLLVALARKPRQVFTREVLLEQVWGYRHAADTRLVNVHVQRLRAKVERDPEHPEVVVTVRGVGYKAGPAPGRGRHRRAGGAAAGGEREPTGRERRQHARQQRWRGRAARGPPARR